MRCFSFRQPLITRPVSAELSLESVMSALPNFPKSKQQQVGKQLSGAVESDLAPNLSQLACNCSFLVMNPHCIYIYIL